MSDSDNTRCKKQPNNYGIFCTVQTRCATCGWNPAEARRRRLETLWRIEQKEYAKGERWLKDADEEIRRD